MQLKQQVPVSTYKWEIVKSLLAIALFLLVYISIGIITLGLTYSAIWFLLFSFTTSGVHFLLVFALGYLLLSLAITIFVFKFLFKKNSKYTDDQFEITRETAPELFQLIKDTAEKVGTNFPDKIYIDGSNNAHVKSQRTLIGTLISNKLELIIGIGLINSVTALELKAIIAHEFGHFSQKSLRINTLAYQVNRAIWDMLYDNEAYDNWVTKWFDRGIYAVFIYVATKYNNCVRSILAFFSKLVTLNFLALSRQLESHADEISATVCGPTPLINYFLRIEYSEQCLGVVARYYEKQAKQNLMGRNIYRDYFTYMQNLSQRNEIPVENGLPLISKSMYSNYTSSKLVLNNQWSSHPEIIQRISNLESKFESRPIENDFPAFKILVNHEEIELHFTELLNLNFEFPESPKFIQTDILLHDLKLEYEQSEYNKAYRGYFDVRGFSRFYEELDILKDIQFSFEELFSDEKLQNIYEERTLKNDLATLQLIENGQIEISSFDYEGERFTKKKLSTLIPELKEKQEQLSALLEESDLHILSYFVGIETKLNLSPTLLKGYNELFEYDRESTSENNVHQRMLRAFQFVHVKLHHSYIKSNFLGILKLENEFKDAFRSLLTDDSVQAVLANYKVESITNYLEKELEYFVKNTYVEDNLRILYLAIDTFQQLVKFKYHKMKQDLLNYQIELQNRAS